MRSSIELWLRFLWFALRALISFRSPLAIDENDVLAKALFSGHTKKSGALKVNAFLINDKSEYGISVHRWSLAPARLFLSLGLEAARWRGTNFKGFAEFNASVLSSIVPDDGWKLVAKGVPTLGDAFHADILLPRDKGEDYYLFIASEFVRKATPVLHQ